jgi:predicted dienelactone hydrolase
VRTVSIRLFLFTLAFAVALSTCSPRASAQQTLTIPRADGHETPLKFYPVVNTTFTCAPLAIISHGAGGSETGYPYLAWAMANLGYNTIVIGHRESSHAVLSDYIQRDGLIKGVTALVADPNAESARLLDLTAALQWANTQCKPPGKIPFKVLLGHSGLPDLLYQ